MQIITLKKALSTRHKSNVRDKFFASLRLFGVKKGEGERLALFSTFVFMFGLIWEDERRGEAVLKTVPET